MGKNAEEVLFEFWPDRFSTQTKDSDSSLAWSAVKKWKEGRGLILLYRHDDFFHVVPVGQFDEDRQRALRALLDEKLGPSDES